MKTEKKQEQRNDFPFQLRKCNTFCPQDFVTKFKDSEEKEISYLYTKYRILWALNWANESSRKLSFPTEICSALTDNEKVTFKCTVLIDDEIVGTGYASEVFSYGNGVDGFFEKTKNVAIETAETRSIGRALARAGFGICIDGDENKENQPCESLPPDFQKDSSTPVIVPSAKDTADPYAISGETEVEKVVNGYKAHYPCNPHKALHLYELEYNQALLAGLEWIKNNFPKENVAKWATFMFDFLSSSEELKKQIHLQARVKLKEEGLIK